MPKNFRKYPEKAKKTSQNFDRTLPANFTVLQYRKFAVISSNLIKIAIFKDILEFWILEIKSIHKFELELPKNSSFDLSFIHVHSCLKWALFIAM